MHTQARAEAQLHMHTHTHIRATHTHAYIHTYTHKHKHIHTIPCSEGAAGGSTRGKAGGSEKPSKLPAANKGPAAEDAQKWKVCLHL